MDLNKKLLALLAIFCVIVSASAVCAGDSDGYSGSNYEDMNGVSGSQYGVSDVENSNAPNGNQNALEPGAGLPLENQTDQITTNTTSNTTGNATINTTGHAPVNATGNSTNATSINNLLSTGNPIMVLLTIIAIVSGYLVVRRNE